MKEFRVMLNKVEAKRVLSTSAPAVVKLKERSGADDVSPHSYCEANHILHS